MKLFKQNVINLNTNSNIENKAEKFIKHIENNLRSGSVKTPQNVKRYYGEKIPNFFNEFTSIICYVASLNKAVIMENYTHVPKSIEKDLKLAIKKGEVSLYLSLVTNAILREIYPDIHCRLVQGFYTYSSKKQTTFSSNITNTGFHAFTIIGEKVIDCNFFSTNPDYETPCPAIIGYVPDDVGFYGWEEEMSIEKLYIEDYALVNHDDATDWLDTHLDMQRDFLVASVL